MAADNPTPVGMLEFGRPSGLARAGWHAYTRAVLPALGRLFSQEWRDVGRFLGPSIDGFTPSNRMPVTLLPAKASMPGSANSCGRMLVRWILTNPPGISIRSAPTFPKIVSRSF